MKYEIRQMTVEDIDAALALWKNTEGIGLDEISDSPDSLAEYLSRNPGLSCVACCSGHLVGAVLCGHDGRRGSLHHLAVVNEYRRKGIARALVGTCLSSLKKYGIPKCNIFLFSTNEAGREFWQHSGWNTRDDLILLQHKTSGR